MPKGRGFLSPFNPDICNRSGFSLRIASDLISNMTESKMVPTTKQPIIEGKIIGSLNDVGGNNHNDTTTRHILANTPLTMDLHDII
jgi:hypothetical protein